MTEIERDAKVLQYLKSRGLTAVVGHDGLVWITCNIAMRASTDEEFVGQLIDVEDIVNVQ